MPGWPVVAVCGNWVFWTGSRRWRCRRRRFDSNPQAGGGKSQRAHPLAGAGGRALDCNDSRVICRYLDHLAGGKLYPEARLWEVLTLEATGLGLSDSAIAMVYQARFRRQ